jgi:hypothetical protein
MEALLGAPQCSRSLHCFTGGRLHMAPLRCNGFALQQWIYRSCQWAARDGRLGQLGSGPVGRSIFSIKRPRLLATFAEDQIDPTKWY